MARWKVTAKHYIHAEQYGQPSEWERTEMNIDTGRNFRKLYKVPMLIDPEDPGCINKHEGICVVARKGTDHPGDIVFFGPPTADMEPLDEEARKETEAERPKWKSPIDGLEMTIGEDFGKKMLEILERQLDAATRSQSSVSLKSTSSEEVQSLKDIVTAQQKQIEQLLQAVVGTKEDIEPIPADPDPEAPPSIKVNRPHNALRR